MSELPIILKIKSSSNPEKLESVDCRSILRAVPGNRQVYDGRWNDKEVIVKVFSKKFLLAYLHLKNEWRGLQYLCKYQLSAPEPLFFGRTTDRRWAIVTGKIADSSTALEVFNIAEDDRDKFRILVLVCKELAKQNSKGVFQKDLHLGNFLVSEGTVYALDPARMKFFHPHLCRAKSICQLALLSCYLPDDDELFDKLCREYFDARNWRFDDTQKALVLKSRNRRRKKQIRQGLKKCMRTSKRIVKSEGRSYSAVFDRNFFESVNPIDFVNKIDSLMDAGRILKKGNTSYVSSTSFNGKDVVVKRYNYKGLLHSLRHTIKGSRARRNWLYGHRLTMLGIPTPKPLAFIEKKKGVLVWQSYIVTEYIEGQKLYDFLKDNSPEQRESILVKERLEILMKELSKYRVTHGDLKHTNILVTKDNVILTDLDSLKFHRFEFIHKMRQSKDVKRLMLGGQIDIFFLRK